MAKWPYCQLTLIISVIIVLGCLPQQSSCQYVDSNQPATLLNSNPSSYATDKTEYRLSDWLNDVFGDDENNIINDQDVIDDRFRSSYSLVSPFQAQDVSQPQLRPPLASAGTPNELFVLEDKEYPRSLFEDYSKRVGQISGLTTLPDDNVAILHRAGRHWDESTFYTTNFSMLTRQQLDEDEQTRDSTRFLIHNNTIMLINRDDGSSLGSFGSDLFALPHSIRSDRQGNLWVSDVARHQVMRLPTASLYGDDVDNLLRGVGIDYSIGSMSKEDLIRNYKNIQPDIVLGEMFVPGNDSEHFCQPADIAVSSSGDLVFVADGYCNRRIMVFNGRGKFVKSFGQEHNMNIVHSLVLFENRDMICAGDRENARILCYTAGLKSDSADPTQIGQLVYVLQYPIGHIYAMTNIATDHLLVSSRQYNTTNHYDLAILNPFNLDIKLVWTSSDLLEPHSLTSTLDQRFAYAADMSSEAYKKVFKFNIIQRRA